MAKKDKQDYRIQAVDHAISILEAFLDEEEYGVTELSKKLNLPKNNIFRLLATLEQRGLIEQNRSSGSYCLGLKAFEIGQVYQNRMGLLKQARPILEDLETKCNETVYLGVMQEGMVVYGRNAGGDGCLYGYDGDQLPCSHRFQDGAKGSRLLYH
jgi:DNA-binding IclR family transcriptional regulator